MVIRAGTAMVAPNTGRFFASVLVIGAKNREAFKDCKG